MAQEQGVETDPRICPHCGSARQQVKAGRNEGLQRYKCGACRRRYTPEPRPRGYPNDLAQRAIQLFEAGVKIREISRQLEVSPQSVANWVRRPTEMQPEPLGTPQSEAPDSEANRVGRAPFAVGEAKEAPEERAGGKKRVTITDVARLAGVSNSTVSNYINNKGHMNEATHGRIRAAVAELHFTPSALTRAIRQRRTHILGVMIFGLTELDENVGRSLAPPLLAGINSAAYDVGRHILLFTGLRHHSHYPPGIEFLDGHIDGLIWVAPELHEPALASAAAAGLPVVAVLTRHVPDGVGYINADNFEAMHLLIAHLTEQGHRRIAFLGSTHNSNFMDRRDGYRRALALANLPYDPLLEDADARPAHTQEDYAHRLAFWLALPEPPTVIVTQSDGSAAWMAEEIEKRGLRIPEDMAVTGFDDIPEAARISGGLTTLRQPFRQIGKLAVERLTALIEGADVNECRITVPTQLIVRSSSVIRV